MPLWTSKTGQTVTIVGICTLITTVFIAITKVNKGQISSVTELRYNLAESFYRTFFNKYETLTCNIYSKSFFLLFVRLLPLRVTLLQQEAQVPVGSGCRFTHRSRSEVNR